MRTFRAFVVLAFAIGAAGCRLDIAVDVTLDRDGGGILAIALAADAELLAEAEAAEVDPLGDLAEAGALLGDGWDVADVALEGGGRRVRLSRPFDNPEELAALSADLAGALDAPEVELLSPLTVAVAADQVALDGHASLVPTDATTDLGLLPQDAVRLLREADALGYTVTVTMPGEVLSSEGEAVDATTVRYVLAPGEETPLATTAVRPPSLLVPRLLAAVAGVLILATASVLFVLIRRARQH